MIQHQIDNLVYTLYSLTDEEIAIVEGKLVPPSQGGWRDSAGKVLWR